jgi:hypothetical protein
MFRRETIIALRARHQAYRVASDILYPHVQTPAPPEPVIPLMEADIRLRGRRISSRAMRIAAAVIWALTALMLVFVYFRPRG